MTIRVPESNCPVCSYRMRCSLPIDGGGAPRPGDISICGNCGVQLLFNDDRGMDLLSNETKKSLDAETRQTLNDATKIIMERGYIVPVSSKFPQR